MQELPLMYSEAYNTDMAVVLETSSVVCKAEEPTEINWPWKNNK